MKRKLRQGLAQILESFGTVDRGWRGWVKAEDYAFFKDKLDKAHEQFLDQTEEDRPNGSQLGL